MSLLVSPSRKPMQRQAVDSDRKFLAASAPSVILDLGTGRRNKELLAALRCVYLIHVFPRLPARFYLHGYLVGSPRIKDRCRTAYRGRAGHPASVWDVGDPGESLFILLLTFV